MSDPGSSSTRGFWSRAARPVVAFSAAGGFALALPFLAVPASAAPADAGAFANPAHQHVVAAHTTSTPLKAAPALSAAAPAHTFHPVAGAPDSPENPAFLGSGQCISLTGQCTLRAAVQEADAEGSYIAIALTSGTYPLTIPPANTSDASTGNLDITDPQTVTLTGAGMTHTFIDATGMGDRIFQLEDHAVARMTGFTIENGNAAQTTNNTHAGYGGGIDINSPAAALVLQSVRVTANAAAGRGGGISAEGSLWAAGSQLTNNTASDSGGGLYSVGSAQLVSDTITGNTAVNRGGGVDVNDGAAAFQGGTVSGNHLVFDGYGGYGGGIYAGNATTLVGTSINDNTIVPSSTATSGTAEGGGLYIDYGLDRADHLTIRGNSVSGLDGAYDCFNDGGGGVYDYYGFTLTNSVVTGNSAPTGNGGGICNYGDTERLTHVTVSGNSAGTDGGGVFGYDVTYVSRSTITDNTAGGSGGGFWSDDGQQIDQTLIANNHAVQGAGVWNKSQMQLTNDTLTANVASGSGNAGGAIYNSGSNVNSTVQVTNVTIAGNRSDDGAGIAQFGGGVTVHNTIIANNRANGSSTDTNCDVSSSGATPLTDAGHDIDSGHTCGLNGPGSRSNTNPKLGALAANGGPTKTMALLSGSPAINAGSSPAPYFDQRNVKRGAKPDIGAFEVAGKG